MKHLLKIFCLLLSLLVVTSGTIQAQSLILDGDVLLDNPNEKFKKLKSTAPYKKIQKENILPLKAKKEVKVVQQEEAKEAIKETIKTKTANLHGNTQTDDVSDIQGENEAPYKENLMKIVLQLFAFWITANFS